MKMIGVVREPGSRTRVEFVALPIAVLAAFLFRAASFGPSMGPDELSLLLMARSILDGAFPYEIYWDVRAPLAYLVALPFASVDDAFEALIALRLLVIFVHMGAAWLFFCLFRRALGVPAAVVGALVLLVSTNLTVPHQLAMPNHFVMGMSLGAFASLVAGVRGRRTAFYCSALLAGTLPWIMVQSGLVTLGLAALVMLADTPLRRTERLTWVFLAQLPSAATIGVFYFWGPFDMFWRTVFVLPYEAIEAAIQNQLWVHSATRPRLPGHVPWAFGLVVIAGAVSFRSAANSAPARSVLRYAGFLMIPAMLAFVAVALVRSFPSPEYFIEAAPAVAFFASIAAARLWHWKGWETTWLSRHMRPARLRVIAVACLGVVMAFPSDPWANEVRTQIPLPTAYCDSARHLIEDLGSRQTVLDLSGVCGAWIFGSGKAFHPPFTYAGNWFRPSLSWVGNAVPGDGSRDIGVPQLRKALSGDSNAGVIVANGLLLDQIRERGWERFFYDEWRQVWYRHVPGHDFGFDRLAVFVRADTLDDG